MSLKYILNIKKREGGRVLIKEGGAGGAKICYKLIKNEKEVLINRMARKYKNTTKIRFYLNLELIKNNDKAKQTEERFQSNKKRLKTGTACREKEYRAEY